LSTVIEEFVAKLGWDVDNSKLIGFQRGIERVDGHMSNMAGKMTGVLKKGFWALTIGAGALGGAVALVSREYSKIEDAEAAFTPLLQSAEKANKLVQMLNDTAATTPFRFEELQSVSGMLLPSMNGDLQKTIEFTRMLGDTAGGSFQRMDSITRGFNKALIKGKVDMEALNVISEGGLVPIYQELGKTVGKTGTVLTKSISAGKISVNDLIETFKRMTNKGGIYFMGMEIASATLSGKISTLKDNVGQAAGAIGKQLSPFLKVLADRLNKVALRVKAWIEDNKELIKSKIIAFIKEIPKWLEKIVYWVPKIAKLIVTFYAISAAVKVLTVATNAFTLAKAIASKIDKLTGLAEFFKGPLTQNIKGATGAMKGLTGAAGVLGAAYAGWQIGTVIHDQIIEPMMKALQLTQDLKDEVEDTSKRDLDRRSEKQLESDLRKAKELESKQRKSVFTSGPTGATATPFMVGGGLADALAYAEERDKLKAHRLNVETALAKKRRTREYPLYSKEQQSKAFYIPEFMASTPSLASMNVGAINTTVNTKSEADPKKIAMAAEKAVEKAVRKAQRNMANE